MKAMKRAAIALSLCVAALGALLGWLWWAPRPQAPAQETATVYEVVNIAPAQLAAVKVENASDAFAVFNGPQGLEMVSQAAATYDNAQLGELVYAAGHISGSRRVTDAATFESYGLSTPRATVTVSGGWHAAALSSAGGSPAGAEHLPV